MRLCVLRVIYWAMMYALCCVSVGCCVMFEKCLCVLFVIYCVLLYGSVCFCVRDWGVNVLVRFVCE